MEKTHPDHCTSRTVGQCCQYVGICNLHKLACSPHGVLPREANQVAHVPEVVWDIDLLGNPHQNEPIPFAELLRAIF